MRRINRRDFLQGSALAIGGLPALARAGSGPAGAYPPALTGMRGSNDGSFEVAHALAWKGQRWPRPASVHEPDYDLIVVGGGLSGLAAAYFYRARVGADARILILDNHDDFGGHARRNEFTVRGRGLIGYGGSQTLEDPGRYSIAARGLLRELGLDTDRFRSYYDGEFDTRHGLKDGVLFAGDHSGGGGLFPAIVGFGVDVPPDQARTLIERYPVGAATKRSLLALFVEPYEFSAASRTMLLAAKAHSCESFLVEAFGFEAEGLAFLRDISRPLWGAGLDTLSIAESVFDYLLGARLAEAAYAIRDSIGDPVAHRDESEPYICHFPDGNASVARMLVRSLIPGTVDGKSMEDIVLARTRYEKLDRPENSVRLRLNSTAVDVRNAEGGVEITYVQGGVPRRVRAAHCVLACYNSIVPHLVADIPDAQKAALDYPEKVPLALVNVAIDNWQALADSGISGFYAPGGFLSYGGMDFPVSMGGYEFSARPDDPAVLQFWHAPARGSIGEDPKAQFRAGRRSLYEMPFDVMEQAIVSQLDAAWGSYGLNVERDIASITVNRWPHGYAYEYMDLWDDPAWSRGAGPHVVGRQQIGNIAIANSDSEQYAYVNGAIDAAYRAVRELTT